MGMSTDDVGADRDVPEMEPAAKRRAFVWDSRVGIRICVRHVSGRTSPPRHMTHTFNLVVRNELYGRVREYAE